MVLWSVFGHIFLWFCTFAHISREVLLSTQLMLFKEVIGLHKNSYRSRCNMCIPLEKVFIWTCFLPQCYIENNSELAIHAVSGNEHHCETYDKVQ